MAVEPVLWPICFYNGLQGQASLDGGLEALQICCQTSPGVFAGGTMTVR